MCDKCDDLDKAIAPYRRVGKQGFDPLTNDRIKEAVSEMAACCTSVNEASGNGSQMARSSAVIVSHPNR